MFVLKVDTRAATRMLSDLQKKQIPFATSRALTAVAKLAVADLQSEMKRVFDRPNRWTLNAFYAKPAKRGDWTAWVATREKAGKGRPAYKYLKVQHVGGNRSMKGFELKLSNLSGGQYVVPTRDTPLDANGNIAAGFLTTILSRLGLAGDQSIAAARSARLRKRKRTVAASGHTSEFFIGRERGTGNGRPTGVFRLVGKGHVIKVLAFTHKQPSYTARFDIEKIVEASVDKHWPRQFDIALAHALATARQK
jgi:hypothetical protein